MHARKLRITPHTTPHTPKPNQSVHAIAPRWPPSCHRQLLARNRNRKRCGMNYSPPLVSSRDAFFARSGRGEGWVRFSLIPTYYHLVLLRYYSRRRRGGVLLGVIFYVMLSWCVVCGVWWLFSCKSWLWIG